MRILALISIALLALTLAACGGDDDGGDQAAQREPGAVTEPATLPEQTDDGPVVSREDFESCVEEQGLQIFAVEEQIPGTQGGRLEVGVEGAEQIAVFWPESEHVADVFIAEDADAAADAAEQEILEFFAAFGVTEDQVRQFVQRTGNVIVTPDNDSGPDADELAQLRDCIAE